MPGDHDTILSLQLKVEEQALLIGKLLAENADLRARLNMNSKNSSKPPSTDGYKKPQPKSRRKRSGKKQGSQPGSPGKNLKQVESPDEVINHSPDYCSGCGDDLSNAVVIGETIRQVFDLPPVKAQVVEHRGERRKCHCGTETTAQFPSYATAPTCYGPNLRALVCYLVVRQHIPIKRVAELLRDSYGIPVSTGTIVAMVKEGANRLDSFLASLADAISQEDVVHVDETGLRVDSSLYWVHSASTKLLTLYHLHKKRGKVGMDAMGVLENISGVLVHDGWSPYRKYTSVRHALCNAHHLRELDAITEINGESWASEMVTLLSETWQLVLDRKEKGATSLSEIEVTTILDKYNKIIEAGHMVNPVQPSSGKRGRTKKTKEANLLNRLDIYAGDVLRFATDFRVSFDNNEAERQVRMVKVQQKISGGFRTKEGASAWLAVRSYIATVMKNGINPTKALQDLMTGDPFMPPIANSS